jgi:hypothetical protein
MVIGVVVEGAGAVVAGGVAVGDVVQEGDVLVVIG